MKVNLLTLQNAEDCLKIENACFSSPWSIEQLQESMENPLSVFLGMFEAGELVGYIGFYLLPDSAEILNTAVLPHHRKKGVATALLNEVYNIAKEKGCTEIFLEVRVSNTPAITLYKKCGFIQYHIRKNYYSSPTEDAILMKYSI